MMQVASDNHLSLGGKICRPPTITSTSVSSSTVNKNQRSICTSIAEDSDSTNNSLASSSGIGGSRDCSGVGPEEENSLTSFEGILLNGVPTNLDIDAQDDGSSKDSSSISCKEKPLQTMMLADLLEKKVDKEPVLNGVLGESLKTFSKFIFKFAAHITWKPGKMSRNFINLEKKWKNQEILIRIPENCITVKNFTIYK